MAPLKRVLGILQSYVWLAIGATASVLLLTAANAVTPQLFRRGIDQGIAPQNLQVVLVTGALMVGVAIARGLFNFGQSYWAEAISQSVAYELRGQVFRKIETLSFSYHDQAQTSQLLTRITSDIEQIRTFVGTSLIQVISSLLTLVTIATILLVMNWRLALVTLAVVPLAGALLFRFFSQNQPLFGQVQERLGDLNEVLRENLLGVRVVKAFVREPVELRRYTQMNNNLVAVYLKTLSAIRNTFPFIFLPSNLITLAVVGYGGAQVIEGTFTIG